MLTPQYLRFVSHLVLSVPSAPHQQPPDAAARFWIRSSHDFFTANSRLGMGPLGQEQSSWAKSKLSFPRRRRLCLPHPMLDFIYFYLYSLGCHPNSLPGKPHVNRAQWPLSIRGQDSLPAAVWERPGAVSDTNACIQLDLVTVIWRVTPVALGLSCDTGNQGLTALGSKTYASNLHNHHGCFPLRPRAAGDPEALPLREPRTLPHRRWRRCG